MWAQALGLIVFVKCTIYNVWQGSEYAYEKQSCEHLFVYCASTMSVQHRNCAHRNSHLEVLLNLSQNSQGNTCASLFFNKVAGLRPETLALFFSVNFAKFLRTSRTPLVAVSKYNPNWFYMGYHKTFWQTGFPLLPKLTYRGSLSFIKVSTTITERYLRRYGVFIIS